MSFARPARCLFCSFSRTAGPRVPRRQFQLSATHLNKATPETKVVNPVGGGKTLKQVTLDMKARELNPDTEEGKAFLKENCSPDQLAELESGKAAVDVTGKTLKEISDELKPEHFKPYTEEEKAMLKQHYTAEQIAAIEAGEGAIDPKDLAEQFRIRKDPMKLKYLDDFSVIEPSVDKHARAPESNTDFNARLKTQDEFSDDFAKFIAEMPEDPTISDWVRFAEKNRMTVGKEENELNPHSSVVPDLFEPGENLKGRGQKPHSYYDNPNKVLEKKSEEPSDALKTLMKITGYSQSQIQNMKTKVLVTKIVANQTRLGKIRSIYMLVVSGNGNGLLGIGEGKSQETGDARQQAMFRAIRNMQPVPRYENRTIFGDVTGKSGAVELKLMTRPPGFGLRCQSLIYELCRAAGIDDLAARVDRCRNKMNTVKAAYQALMSQKDPEEISRARGKKLVDVRKVYYSGKAERPSKRQGRSTN